jgi:hypothetical protein
MARWTLALMASCALVGCDSEPFAADGQPTQSAVARVELTVAAGEMNPGDTAVATAKAYSAGGDLVPFLEFVWQLTDSSVVSVEAGSPSETAKVTAMAVGTSSLTARVGGVTSSPVVMTVVEPDTTDTGGS